MLTSINAIFMDRKKLWTAKKSIKFKKTWISLQRECIKYKDYVSCFCGRNAGKKSVSKALVFDFLVIVFPCYCLSVLLITCLVFKRNPKMPKKWWYKCKYNSYLCRIFKINTEHKVQTKLTLGRSLYRHTRQSVHSMI